MFRPAFGQSFTWNTTSLGVEDETFDNFAIYPVPAQSNIQVSGLGGIPAQYAIFDITGRAVKQGETNGDAIDVQALSSGTYIVRLNRSGEVATRKFIKS